MYIQQGNQKCALSKVKFQTYVKKTNVRFPCGHRILLCSIQKWLIRACFLIKNSLAESFEFANNFRVYLPKFGKQKFQTKIFNIARVSGTYLKRHLDNLSGFYWS